MSWVALLKVLLQLGLSISNTIRERQLLSAGEAKATARSLAEMAKRLDIADQVTAEVAAMTDAELDTELGL